jgi:hypothetical protein
MAGIEVRFDVASPERHPDRKDRLKLLPSIAE